MSELDDFRPRIRNWARVFRERIVRRESNLMWVIRALQRANLVSAEEERNETPDFRDANFLDQCILDLRNQSQIFNRDIKTLKAEYLTKFSSETFEENADYEKAKKFRARYAEVFPFMYEEILNREESMLMNFVHKRENNPFE